MPEQKTDTSKPQQPAKPMEDDDEFEEFDVEGSYHSLAWQADCREAWQSLVPELSSQDGKRKMRIRPKQSCGRLTGTIPASVITLQSSSEKSCKDIQRSEANMRGPSHARSDVPPALHSHHNVLRSVLKLTLTGPHGQTCSAAQPIYWHASHTSE